MIYKYLLEIKYRVFFSIFTWSFILINSYYFKETLLYIVMKFSLNFENSNVFYFLTTNVSEIFLAYLQLSCHVANQITLIFVYCQIFIYLSTGLYVFEYSYLRIILCTTVFCWITCIYVLNNFIFPFSWNFFLKFQEYLSYQKLTFYFEIKLNEYLMFYKSIHYICTLIYQVAVFFFIFLDLFKTNLLIIKKLKKVFYFSFFIFSTFITPPEVLYQLLTSFCVIIIYELSVFYIIFKIELSNFKLVIN